MVELGSWEIAQRVMAVFCHQSFTRLVLIKRCLLCRMCYVELPGLQQVEHVSFALRTLVMFSSRVGTANTEARTRKPVPSMRFYTN